MLSATIAVQQAPAAPTAGNVQSAPRVERTGTIGVRLVHPVTLGAAQWKAAPANGKREQTFLDSDGRPYLVRIIDLP